MYYDLVPEGVLADHGLRVHGVDHRRRLGLWPREGEYKMK